MHLEYLLPIRVGKPRYSRAACADTCILTKLLAFLGNLPNGIWGNKRAYLAIAMHLVLHTQASF